MKIPHAFRALKDRLKDCRARVAEASAPPAQPASGTASERKAHPSLVRRAARLSAGLVALFLVFSSAVLFAVSYHEAAEHQDDVLEETAGILARTNVVFRETPPAFEVLYMDDDDFEERYLLDDSDPRAGVAQGDEILVNTLHKSGRALRLRPAYDIPGGHSTVEIGGERWRILLLGLKNGHRVAVAQKTDDVWEEALNDALSSAIPILLFTGLLGLTLGWVLKRMTAPVRSLRETLAAKTGEDLAPVVDEAIPSEIQPLVDAVNGLLSRVGELREREARFVADAAHELRSPLAALSLQAERLSKEQLSPAARERVDNLRRVIDRAVRQVNQLLALKRAQASATQAASSASGTANSSAAATPAADIAAAIGRAVEDVWPDIERKRLEFEVEGLDDDASDDDRLFPISEDDLFTILRNLLENAARYTPEGDAVRLRCELGRKRITVRDTGPGIASEERGRVFDPFYRVLGTGVTGTGLGLAIVKTLAEKYGWRVTLADAAPTAAPGAKGLAVTIEPCED